jgi:nucleotide-binding universal stress UspA family protein
MYSKILVPIDGSAPSMLGLAEAVGLAKLLGSRLALVHVVNEAVYFGPETPPMRFDRLVDELRAAGRATLEKAERFAHEHGLESEKILVESIGGAAADVIVQEAGRRQADLIVMGTHGRRGFKRLALGSDAELVVRGSTIPVLLVREPRSGKLPVD